MSRHRQGQEAAPVPASSSVQRITTIDVARGIAVLGIFAINLPDMGYPEDLVLYPGPPAVTGAGDRWVLYVSEVLFSGKMRGLFAVIFGLSATLYVDTLVAGKGQSHAAKTYYKRLFWLGVLGLVNAYLFLWWGDILFQYALVGLILFPLMKLDRFFLFATMVACLGYLVLQPALEYGELRQLRTAGAEIEAVKKAGEVPSPGDAEILAEWDEALADLAPDDDRIAESVSAHRGGYLQMFEENALLAFEEQTVLFLSEGLADILLYMALGVLLARLVLAGNLDLQRIPIVLPIAALCVGIAVNVLVFSGYFRQQFDPVRTAFYMSFFELGRMPMVLGYLFLIITVFARLSESWVRAALAATGKMALTNYLVQSIIGMLLFSGFGFDQYSLLSRSELALIICVVWASQVAFSVVWLRRFEQGPFEWLWRSLISWNLRPLTRT